MRLRLGSTRTSERPATHLPGCHRPLPPSEKPPARCTSGSPLGLATPLRPVCWAWLWPGTTGIPTGAPGYPRDTSEQGRACRPNAKCLLISQREALRPLPSPTAPEPHPGSSVEGSSWAPSPVPWLSAVWKAAQPFNSHPSAPHLRVRGQLLARPLQAQSESGSKPRARGPNPATSREPQFPRFSSAEQAPPCLVVN